MDYGTALQHFNKRSPLRRRLNKSNNTWLHRASTEKEALIFVRLFQTDILTFDPDGSFSVNIGRYPTPTTLGRLRQYLPKGCYVWTERMPNGGFIAGLHTASGSRPYSSECRFNSRFEREDLEEMNCRCAGTVRAQVHEYAKAYVKLLVKVGLPAKLHECNRCRRVLNDDDDQLPEAHYLEHIDRGTMPAALLLSAIRAANDRQLETPFFALLIGNRLSWQRVRTRQEALERQQAALMGLGRDDASDPRGYGKIMRLILEVFLIEQLGFECVQPRTGLHQGMYKDMTVKEAMGW